MEEDCIFCNRISKVEQLNMLVDCKSLFCCPKDIEYFRLNTKNTNWSVWKWDSLNTGEDLKSLNQKYFNQKDYLKLQARDNKPLNPKIQTK